ncbi:MAG: hypothetical protein KAG98_06700 [Lentisphaeria bacterium]|nr:hypothetical protein [Lentisphaeria bacterium]
MSKQMTKQQQNILLALLLTCGLGYAFYEYLLVPQWKSIADLKVKAAKGKTELISKQKVVADEKRIHNAFSQAYAQVQRLKDKSFAPKIDIVVWLANYTKQFSKPYGLNSNNFHYRQVGITNLVSDTLNVKKHALEDFQIEIDAISSLDVCNKVLVDCEKNPLGSVLSMELKNKDSKSAVVFRFVIPRLNAYGYSMLSTIEKFITKQGIQVMKDDELDEWIKQTKSLLFYKRDYLDYPVKGARNIFKLTSNPKADKLALSKRQANVIKRELEKYKVGSVINGVKPMCKFTNGNKWYKIGETFYVGTEKLPVVFSKVLSHPTRVLLTSGDVEIIKEINKK